MKQFETKKSLGQHFLTHSGIPMKMCDAAGVTKGDVVVEVGPGTGVLTAVLLARGATVHAIETDVRALHYLRAHFRSEIANGTLVLHEGDMRTFAISTLPITHHHYTVVANIPYYLTGFLFRTFLESETQPHTIVFLTQKEVARRITETGSEHGTASLLSLSVAYYGTPEYVATVKRGNFTPPPKVDSAIVRVTDITAGDPAILPEVFFRVLKTGFGQKRKQLRGNLTALYSREVIDAAFTECHITKMARAETLPIERWKCLIQALET